MDNGPKLISRALQQFCENKTGLVYIPPDHPWVNGHIESFNIRIRKAVPFPERGTSHEGKTDNSEPDSHFSVTLGVCTRHAKNCRHSAHVRDRISSGSRGTSIQR